MNILKNEAIRNHIEIAKFHSNVFSEQLTQTLNSIEHTVSGLSFFLENTNSRLLEKNLNDILTSNPYIRSLNIVDENNFIIKSSNSKNIGYKIDISDYYPTPVFDKYILRFGELEYGRDINQSDTKLVYIPISKKVSTLKGDYTIIIVINIDNFVNRYKDSIAQNLDHIDIIRVDGKLLYSTEKNHKLNSTIVETKFYKDSLEKSFASGEEFIKDNEYLTSYQLSELYPLNIAIKLDYKESLRNWEEKRVFVLLLLSFLIFLCAVLIIALILKYDKSRAKEIAYEKEKNQSRKRFQIIFEQNNFLISIVKVDGTILQINNKVEKFLNKKREEVVGSKFYNLLCWEGEGQKWLKENILSYNKNITIKKEVIVKDIYNTDRCFDVEISSIEFDGQIELVIIGNDITEEKLNADKLKNAYTVFDNTNDGILITDEDAKIVDVNKAFTKNTGYTLLDVVGKNPNILKSQRHDNDFYNKMWKVLEKDNFWHGEIVNKNKDGSFYVELLTINRILKNDGSVKNYIAVFTNITKQKKQEKLLKEKEQILFQQSKMAAMGEMLENIAHQWRQPLSVISTAASGIQMQKEFNILDEKVMDESLQLIVTTTEHLSSTIDDFRNFFKQDKEEVEFLLAHAIEKSLNIVISKFRNRSIVIEKELTGITILGFENELVQVIMNILNNSKDVLEKKDIDDRVILIKTFIENQKAYLTIQDSGGGIPEDIIDKVFEPYFTTKHQAQGTGIGLYMSAEIISKHMNGTVSVENKIFQYKEKKYKGACFIITFPLS
ncbi:MAG: PAS domain S-box protein [Arcobacteraceae bacterium]|nr:PAS domain S-box protein [Arcobacteraceae bacterium]